MYRRRRPARIEALRVHPLPREPSTAERMANVRSADSDQPLVVERRLRSGLALSGGTQRSSFDFDSPGEPIPSWLGGSLRVQLPSPCLAARGLESLDDVRATLEDWQIAH
jgi:hypothetical protein